MYVLILPRGRSLLAPLGLLGKCNTVILVMLGLTDDQDIMTRQHAFIGQVDVFFSETAFCHKSSTVSFFYQIFTRATLC